jgi:phage-related protein
MALISVTISGNAGPLKKSLDESESRLGKFGSGLAKFGVAAGAAFAAAGAAAVVMGKQLIAAGEAAATSNARIEQITTSMGLFGDEAGKVTDRLVKLAEKTALQTGVDQNAIKATQAKLLTFGELAKSADEVGGQFDRATQAAIDLAAAGFGQATENAVQLGKALNDPVKGISALARSGVTFTESEKARIETLVAANKESEAQVLILEAIEKQVGGTAVATANASDKIRVAFSQVQERLGQALLPVFERFSTFLIDTVFPVMERIGNRAIPVIRKAIERLVSIIRSVATPVLDLFRLAFDRVRQVVENNSESIQKIQRYFGNLVTLIRDKIAPIVINVLGGAFKFIFQNIFPFLLDGLFKFMGVMADVGSFVIKIAGTILDAFTAIANGIIDAINFVIRQMNRIPGVNISEISGVSFTLPSFGGEAPKPSGFMGSPDRLPSGGAPRVPSLPDLDPDLPTGGGSGGGGGGGGGGRAGLSIDARSLATGGLTLGDLADYGTLESARLADLALMNAQSAVVQNITVNTVTADENFPTLLVDNLQRYNLIYGPAEIEIAI